MLSPKPSNPYWTTCPVWVRGPLSLAEREVPTAGLSVPCKKGFSMKLLPFQREFLKAVENPRYDTVAISGPRHWVRRSSRLRF